MLDRGPGSQSSLPARQTCSTLQVDWLDKTWTLGTPVVPDLHQKHEIGIWAQIEPLLRSLYAYYKNILENINFCEI